MCANACQPLLGVDSNHAHNSTEESTAHLFLIVPVVLEAKIQHLCGLIHAPLLEKPPRPMKERKLMSFGFLVQPEGKKLTKAHRVAVVTHDTWSISRLRTPSQLTEDEDQWVLQWVVRWVGLKDTP